ncbi:polyprenyl synthetase family protein, partial [Streptomyces sp. C1-2]|uniref:polyprenyl synthetase family protein n=1 Tax=Streptomyces sp. C1-2 TaxID=2720022 RepID=UPI0016A58770
ECLEILHTGGRPDTDTSLKVIRYKTAKYTVEQPLLLGALLAGAAPDLRAGFSAYGLPLGEAFQLRDDLLGLFGDPVHTGKAPLDDLRGRRPTALLARAWQAAPPDSREELAGMLGRPDSDEEDLARVRELLVGLEAPKRVEEMIDTRVGKAIGVLDGLAVPAPARRALSALAHSATDRRH